MGKQRPGTHFHAAIRLLRGLKAITRVGEEDGFTVRKHKQHAVAAGDRVTATNIYLSATEGNLTDAHNFVRTLTAEKIEAAEAEKK